MRESLIAKCAALSIALLLVTMAGPNVASAQSLTDYDADDDGLLEIKWLEQMNAVRWDLDGDGVVDNGGYAEAYSEAFPNAVNGMGCADGCRGYELTRDLDFKKTSSYRAGTLNEKWTRGDGWLPIAVGDTFHSVFDGNGLVISNLYIDRVDDDQPEISGLFARNGGEITRLDVIDASVSGRRYAGSLAGVNSGEIRAAHAVGNVTSKTESAGGLVGINYGEISYSTAGGSVLSGEFAGGLVGLNRGRISHSHADGEVSGESYAGGLVGYNRGEISYSAAEGPVSSDSTAGGLAGYSSNLVEFAHSSGIVSAPHQAGGLVGINSGVVRYTYSVSNVTGRYSAGGLVGINDNSVTASYATGYVSVGAEDGSAEVAAGGFVGQNRGNIASCYAAGRVVGSVSDEEELDELRVDVGGFAGRNQENGIIRFSFSLGTPISRNEDASLGGFVGRNDASNAIIDGYWKREPPVRYAGVGEGDAPEVKGKSLEQLQSPTEYTDIYADWLIDLDNADEDYDETTGVDDVWNFGMPGDLPALRIDVDGDGVATWWEAGSQNGRVAPTPTSTAIAPPTITPTPIPTSTATAPPTITPTPIPTATVTAPPTITPTPTQTDVPMSTAAPTTTATNTPIPTATPSSTMTPLPTDTPVLTETVTHTPVPTATPEPTETPVPPTQTPVIVMVVVTATPLADAPSGGGCNSVGVVPGGAAAANMFFVVAPLAVIWSVRFRRRRKAD